MCEANAYLFNAGQEEADARPVSENFFQGIASPAGAGLAILPLIISFEFGPQIGDYPHLVGIWVILVSLGMVSQLPTYSFKKIGIPHEYKSLAMVGAGLFMIVLVSAPWPTLICVGIAQIISIPFSYRHYRRLEREAALANVEPLRSERQRDHEQSNAS